MTFFSLDGFSVLCSELLVMKLKKKRWPPLDNIVLNAYVFVSCQYILKWLSYLRYCLIEKVKYESFQMSKLIFRSISHSSFNFKYYKRICISSGFVLELGQSKENILVLTSHNFFWYYQQKSQCYSCFCYSDLFDGHRPLP